MSSTYEIVYYQNGNCTATSKMPTKEAATDVFVASVERYTTTDGFYVDSGKSDSYTVFDMSYAARTIKLVGAIDDELKAALKQKWSDLLQKMTSGTD